MIIFITFIAAVALAFNYLLHKAVSEYSYYGDTDTHKHVDYWYYQTKVNEKETR